MRQETTSRRRRGFLHAAPLGVIAGIACAAAGPATVPPGAATAGVGQAPGLQRPGGLWDDGLAEVARYDATRTIYGKPRSHEAILITVKESFLANDLVKADGPADPTEGWDVLKQNRVLTVPTPNYPYRFLVSVFVRRDFPAVLVKETVGSQEWCGNTFHEVLPAAGPAIYRYHSYFAGEGDGQQLLEVHRGDWFEDALPLTLRFLRLAEGRSITMRLWPSRVSNHVTPFEPRMATVTGRGETTVEAVGKTWPCAVLDVVTPQSTATYWIAQDEAHTLVAMEATDGRSLHLRAVSRRDYWTRDE